MNLVLWNSLSHYLPNAALLDTILIWSLLQSFYRRTFCDAVCDAGSPARLQGELAVSRAFGDRHYRQYGLTADPELQWHNTSAADRWLVLMSDGVLESMSEDLVCQLAAATELGESLSGCCSNTAEIFASYVDQPVCQSICSSASILQHQRHLIVTATICSTIQPWIPPTRLPQHAIQVICFAWANAQHLAIPQSATCHVGCVCTCRCSCMH